MPYSRLTKGDSPYYDDFDKTKNFMRVIFNPARAVQARELTQLQTILSHQISSLGDHLFKGGSSIIGAEVSVIKDAPYVIIATQDLVAQSDDTTIFAGFYNNAVIAGGLIGMHFKQSTTDAIGEVVQVDDLNGTLRLHMKMHSGTFVTDTNVSHQLKTYNMTQVDAGLGQWQTKTSGTHVTATGNALKARVGAGIIYAAGMFITVAEKEEIFINPALNTGDYTIGFLVQEEDISSGDDVTLEDPASGTNFGAAGANRWKVSTQLVAYSLSENPPENYYQALRYESTKLVEKQKKTDYADIMDMLARRTHDESGSYVVEPFSADAIVKDGANFQYRISSGKAYVTGYEIEKITNTFVSASKARTTRTVPALNLQSKFGTWVEVHQLDISTSHLFDARTYPKVHLMSAPNGTGKSIGTARVTYIEDVNAPNNVLIYLGDSATLNADLSNCSSLAMDVGGTPTPAQGYVNIQPWTTARKFLKNTPIIELPQSTVKAVTSANYQTILVKEATPPSGGQFTLSAGTGATFAEPRIIAAQVVSTGEMLDVETVFPINSIDGENTGTLTINNTHQLSNAPHLFWVKVNKTAAAPRVKTLTPADIGLDGSLTSDGDGVIRFDGSNGWPEHYDVTYIELIQEDPAGSPKNVTASGRLDDGQRNYYYGYASISGLKPLTAYRVKMHHWVHSGTGDYFSADSYDTGTNPIWDNWGGDDGDVAIPQSKRAAYYHIPKFTNEEQTKTYDLRNGLDFRRTIIDINASNVRQMVEPNSTVQVNYTYYLPRIDKVWIDSSGKIGVTEGIPEENPVQPPDLANTITLFINNVPAYVFGQGTVNNSENLPEIAIASLDHRNYTMRDIGDLESRLASLEYYTSENQLSSESYSEDVFDVNGQSKSKNGIFVEKFIDHRNGLTSDREYRCSMDKNESFMRCPYEMNHIDFQPDPNETQSNINMGEHTFTLSYTSVPYITQRLESGCMNINPFAVSVWAGDVILNPMSDNWIETKYLPVLQVNDPALEKSIIDLYKREDAGIPNWGEWDTSVIGRGTKFTWFGGNTGMNTEITKYKSTRDGTVLEESGSQTITKDLGERTLDVTSIPFMREKVITFKADGLKPQTAVRVFFGDVDVTSNSVLVDDVEKGAGSWTVVTKTDATGHIEGQFTVPEERFRTGKNSFVIQDAPEDPMTIAATEFTAQGSLVTKQKNVLSVEVPTYSTVSIAETTFSQTQVNSGVTGNITTGSGSVYRDPLAQTFVVEDAGGIFLDSVDIFFCTKDRYLPVTLQIVEVATGLPTQKIVPFGSVTRKASDIIATRYENGDFIYAADHYTALDHSSAPDSLLYSEGDLTAKTDGYTPTKFEFSDPVYLKENTEYAIVLLSNSNNYNVRVAEIGQRDGIPTVNGVYDAVAGRNIAIASQPYMGSLLMSQNSSTWTPVQQKDLMFTIHRCNFDTATTSNLFLRTRAHLPYWNSAAEYLAADGTQVIFDDGSRHRRYICIVDTSAGQSPTTHPHKWQLVRGDGQYDAALLNITYDSLLLGDTKVTSQYAFTNGTMKTFQNKTNIELDTLQSVKLYEEDNGWNTPPYTVDALDVKLTLTSGDSRHTPIISRNRTSAILVNNLVKPVKAGDSSANFDAGEYISKSVTLTKKSTDLKVLLDILNTDKNADAEDGWDSVVVKYRTTKKTLRYVEMDAATSNNPVDLTLQDNICRVYWIDNALIDPDTSANKNTYRLTGTDFTPRGKVVIDGFNTKKSPARVYLSSIANVDDFVVDGAIGYNPWTMITSEPDLDDDDIYIYNSKVTDDYVVGDYVIENQQLYVVDVAATKSQPSQNSGIGGDYIRLDTVFTQDVVKFDTESEWILMNRVSTPPPDFDSLSQYYEHEFTPSITPSEEFDDFAIKIEMYSDDEVHVPRVRKLRAIATA